MAENYGGYYDVEDTVNAIFKTESGVMGNGIWCYVADHDEEEMLIVGDKGRISTTGLFYGPIKVIVDGNEEVIDYQEPEHVAQPYIQTIVNELIGKEKSPAGVNFVILDVLSNNNVSSSFSRALICFDRDDWEIQSS